MGRHAPVMHHALSGLWKDEDNDPAGHCPHDVSCGHGPAAGLQVSPEWMARRLRRAGVVRPWRRRRGRSVSSGRDPMVPLSARQSPARACGPGSSLFGAPRVFRVGKPGRISYLRANLGKEYIGHLVNNQGLRDSPDRSWIDCARLSGMRRRAGCINCNWPSAYLFSLTAARPARWRGRVFFRGRIQPTPGRELSC